MDKDEVKAELKKRSELYKLVDAASKQFEIENDLHSLDGEMIERFLSETNDIQLDQASKLIFLAGRCGLSWERISKIYRYTIGVLGENCPTYAIWIAAGVAMMENKDLDLSYRKQIAHDVESLIKESSMGSDSSHAGFWCQFYTKHPLRDEADPKWSQHAAKWLEIYVEELKETGECGPHEMCELADAYRGLGKLADAARLYREALSYNSKGCCENTYPENIRTKLALCGNG